MRTHQKLLYHTIFSTKNRQLWLTDGFRERVFAYMAGTAKELNGFALKVGGFYDHSHLPIRIPAKIAVSDFVIKLNRSRMSIWLCWRNMKLSMISSMCSTNVSALRAFSISL